MQKHQIQVYHFIEEEILKWWAIFFLALKQPKKQQTKLVILFSYWPPIKLRWFSKKHRALCDLGFTSVPLSFLLLWFLVLPVIYLHIQTEVVTSAVFHIFQLFCFLGTWQDWIYKLLGDARWLHWTARVLVFSLWTRCQKLNIIPS